MQGIFCRSIRIVVTPQLLALGTFGKRVSLIYCQAISDIYMRCFSANFLPVINDIVNNLRGSHCLVQYLTLLMDFNAYAISYHESGDYDMAPALSSSRNQGWGLMAVQSPAPPETNAQNLDVYQTASLGPSLSLTQHAPLELQGALTQRRFETLDDSYMIKEQSCHFQEDVTMQIDRTPYPNEDDWEQHKPKMIDLYQKMPLKDLMATMKRDHAFKAR